MGFSLECFIRDLVAMVEAKESEETILKFIQEQREYAAECGFF